MLAAAIIVALAGATFQPVTAATTAQPPQVFVRDASAPAQTGDNGRAHDSGLRPPGDNDPTRPRCYNAHGDIASRSRLGEWRDGDRHGDLRAGAAGGVRVHTTLPRADPERAATASSSGSSRAAAGPCFTPLDIIGATNSFFADGDGNGELIVVRRPTPIPPDAQLVLVYHSDGTDHQSSIGDARASTRTRS